MIELKTGIKMQVIIGKFITYSELIADEGYCFYDKDVSENERQYSTILKSPIKDVLVLKDKYISIQGDAEKLNQELVDRMEQQMQAELETQN